jgi:ABC-type nitrate/sulfonate/bicarbonate transport system permease component
MSTGSPDLRGPAREPVTPASAAAASETPTRWVRTRTQIRRESSSYALSVAGVATVLLAWYAVTSSGLLSEERLPSPGALGEAFTTLAGDGYQAVSLWAHAWASLTRTLIGFIAGAFIGIPLGLLSGSNQRVRAVFAPLAAFMRPIPPIAFIPLIVIWFGLGETGKIVLIFFTSFNYTFINAQAGAAGTPKQLRRAAQTLGLSGRQTFFKVSLPAALPEIFTGLKVAMALSWAVVVAAELVGAQKGLGYMISDAALLFQIDIVFVGIIMIGLIGLVLNGGVALAEKKIVHWAGR